MQVVTYPLLSPVLTVGSCSLAIGTDGKDLKDNSRYIF